MNNIEYLTINDLVNLLKIPKNTIYYYVQAHPRFPYIKIGKHLRFEKVEIIKYFKERTRKKKIVDFNLDNPLCSLKSEYSDSDHVNSQKEN